MWKELCTKKRRYGFELFAETISTALILKKFNRIIQIDKQHDQNKRGITMTRNNRKGMYWNVLTMITFFLI